MPAPSAPLGPDPLAALCTALPWDPALLHRDAARLPAFRHWLTHAATPKHAERFARAHGLSEPEDFWRRPESERAAAVDRLIDAATLGVLPDALWVAFATGDRDDVRCGLHRLDPAPLPANTWLIHFSHDARALFEGGELRGTACAAPAALRATYDADKPGPGFNFAFQADGFEARCHGADDFYGDGALLFRAPGVRLYHSGDEDEEVVFWGADMGDAFLLHRGDVGRPWRASVGAGGAVEHSDIAEVIRQLQACAALRGW